MWYLSWRPQPIRCPHWPSLLCPSYRFPFKKQMYNLLSNMKKKRHQFFLPERHQDCWSTIHPWWPWRRMSSSSPPCLSGFLRPSNPRLAPSPSSTWTPWPRRTGSPGSGGGGGGGRRRLKRPCCGKANQTHTGTDRRLISWLTSYVLQRGNVDLSRESCTASLGVGKHYQRGIELVVQPRHPEG